MPYVPLNVNVYAAAFAGATAGIGVPTGAFITDPVAADYVTIVAVAAAYAQAVDTAWGAGVANAYDIEAITDGSTNIFTRGPGHPLVGAVTTQVNWTIVAMALVALIREGDADAIAEGITLPPLSTPGAPFAPIANLVALALFDVGTGAAQLPAGAEVYLLTLKCPLRLVKYAGAPPALVPFQTFAVLAGGVIDPLLQWQRLSACYAENSTANPWLAQLTWRITVTGNDENVGTPASPLATLDEWKRRIEDSILGPADALAPILYTIQLLTDQLTLDLRPHIGPMGVLVIDGQLGAIITAVGVVGAGGLVPPLIVIPPANPEYYLIQGPPGWDWSFYIGQRCRMLDGPSAGATFYVIQSNPEGLLDNTWARITEPMTVDLTATTVPTPILGLGIVAGNSFNIEDFPQWNSLTARPYKELASNGVPLSVIVANGNFGAGGMAPQVAVEIDGPLAALPLIYGCRLSLGGGGGGSIAAITGTGLLWGCHFPTFITSAAGKNFWESLQFQFCGFGNQFTPGAGFVNATYCRFMDSVFNKFQIIPQPGGWLLLGGVIGVFDVGGFALAITGAMGTTVQQDFGTNFYGIGPAQNGILIDTPGAGYMYDAANPPLVSTGGVIELRLTGNNILYAALPATDAATLAFVRPLVP